MSPAADIPCADPKISIVIPTLNAERCLGACLQALAPGALEGLVKEAIIADGGSCDETRFIADAAGARIIAAPPGRGPQLRAGAAAARGEYLLFLHADTVLNPSWLGDARAFMDSASPKALEDKIGVFTLHFDTEDWRARLIAKGAMARTKMLALPYGDQGMLIARGFYERLGGYRALALFEDVEFMERAVRDKGVGVLEIFKTKAVTSADRYRAKGYARQAFANLVRLARYKAGVPVKTLAEEYRR